MTTRIKNPLLRPALIASLGLMLAGRVTAQDFTTLQDFKGALVSNNASNRGHQDRPVPWDLLSFGGSVGSNPQSGLILSGNTMYGTTYFGGGAGNGAVFKVNADGTGRTNLYSFSATDFNGDNSDGAYPGASLILSGNTLYGTASAGGSAGHGTVFALNTNGTGFTNLHSLSASSDGSTPLAGLILLGDMLYGTAFDGGPGGNGTVFALNTNGSGFTNLHSFAASQTNSSGIFTNSDGVAPQAPLILVGNTLCGTATGGGSADSGTVFALNTNGSGFTNLHSFTATEWNTNSEAYTNSDGVDPQAGLILSGNTLYGTAAYGGSAGNGTVFALNTNGSGFTNLHSFTAMVLDTNSLAYTNSDGANPAAGLILSGNTLYGTAYEGGSEGLGTVFSLSPNGSGFTNLRSFGGGGTSPSGVYTNSFGVNPLAGLVSSGNTLYGTASGGGTAGWGVMFALNTNGTGVATLGSFGNGSPGANPKGGLVLWGNTLYGTTQGLGPLNGTVFKLNTNGTGFTVLYAFNGIDDGADPQAGLILSGNTLYGTASAGGSAGNGTVFALNPDGSGFTNLHSFTATEWNTNSEAYTNSDGANPAAGLILSGNTLYGTAPSGGSTGNGTVFALHTDGTGFTNLYSFTGLFDGADPQAGLILSGNTLYGTTTFGGTNDGGTVFALNTDGTGFTNLYSFTGLFDGADPQAGLILSGNTLYGTATGGGSADSGTVFALNTNGSGFTTLYSFTAMVLNTNSLAYTNSDGADPQAGLILSGNTLYGTTFQGGTNANGTVFGLYTDGTGFTPLHSFNGLSDGANPGAGLVSSANTLYGTASSGGGTDSGTVFSLSSVTLPPVAQFAAGPTIGAAPLSVSFTNLSNGATNYAWAFGDGKFSALANPVNTYSNPSAYSVTLTAVGPSGTNQLTITNYIVVVSQTLLGRVRYSAQSGFQFIITNEDGAAMTASEQSRIQIYAATNPVVALTNWTVLTNATVLTNGVLQINDPASLLYPRRFYRSALGP